MNDNAFALVIGVIVGCFGGVWIGAALTAETVESPPACVCPAPVAPKCEPLTPSEYRDELVRSAQALDTTPNILSSSFVAPETWGQYGWGRWSSVRRDSPANLIHVLEGGRSLCNTFDGRNSIAATAARWVRPEQYADATCPDCFNLARFDPVRLITVGETVRRNGRMETAIVDPVHATNGGAEAALCGAVVGIRVPVLAQVTCRECRERWERRNSLTGFAIHLRRDPLTVPNSYALCASAIGPTTHNRNETTCATCLRIDNERLMDRTNAP